MKAFYNSYEGLVTAYKNERSFREDLLICALFIPLALFADISHLQKAVLLMSLLILLIAELANTAIETIVDRISSEKRPLSKRAKDVGSAMVLLALINAAATWALVFFV